MGVIILFIVYSRYNNLPDTIKVSNNYIEDTKNYSDPSIYFQSYEEDYVVFKENTIDEFRMEFATK